MRGVWEEFNIKPAVSGQVDIAVVEAGLGGATDATNVFTPENLCMAIITALGREHEATLGRPSCPLSAVARQLGHQLGHG